MERVKEQGAKMEESFLIDDSSKNCDIFTSLGGTAYCTKNEMEVLGALKRIME